MLTGLNHITLAVNDLDVSLDFYTTIGFKLRARWVKGAYLEVGDTWVCLALDPPVTPRGDDTHLAFSTTPAGMKQLGEVIPAESRWRHNRSEGASLYFTDPDGHKLEAHIGDLGSRLASLAEAPYEGLEIYRP